MAASTIGAYEHVTAGRTPVIIAYSDYSYLGVPGTDILLLAASIREYGGNYAETPIWIMHAEEAAIQPDTVARAGSLGVEFKPYRSDRSLAPYPFAMKGLAAAEAERLAEGSAPILVWFDRDSVVVRDIAPLMLESGKAIAFRPVNGKNIGQEAGSDPDGFWAAAYGCGGIDPDAIGTTTSYLEGLRLRFYIAAGLLTVRPERGLLRRWARLQRRFADNLPLAALCAQSAAHRLFMHQAALSIAVASDTAEEERQVLPPLVMYPLNFWTADPVPRRPAMVDDVVTFRYDEVMNDGSWKEFAMSPGLKSWLEAHIHPQQA